MIYYMDGKTFLTKYINEDPRKVLRTQYVIVSSTIRKTGKHESQVINANMSLYPPQELLLDYEDYKKNEEYQLRYIEHIKESAPLFATLIKYSIDECVDIVFLCSVKEKQYCYFKLIQSYIEEEFQYHIYNYNKLKKEKDANKKYDELLTLQICGDILKEAKKTQKKNKLSSERGRQEYFGNMSRKKLKKKLKKRGLYEEGLTTSSMRELLDLLM